MSMPDFLADKVEVDTRTGCWTWTLSTARGYARWSIDGPAVMVHRWTYEQVVGPIPDGLQLDHRCHTDDPACAGGESCRHRACANPAHLEPVTPRENVHRSPQTLASINGRKTTCPLGHPYSGVNLKGHRICRVCKAASQREYLAGRRVLVEATS